MSTRRFVAVGLLLALLVAGVASFYASSHPDGLEHVAEQTGFLDSADDSAVADSPIADYQTRGVDNERLSGGIAGLVGALVTLAIAGGLFMVLRRRGDGTDGATTDDEPSGREPSDREPSGREPSDSTV